MFKINIVISSIVVGIAAAFFGIVAFFYAGIPHLMLASWLFLTFILWSAALFSEKRKKKVN